MYDSDMVMFEEEYNQINDIIKQLHVDANAKIVFLVDKNGQLISACGELDNIDTTSLASLAAGNIAATGGLAKLLDEKEFSTLYHEGERDHIHITVVGGRGILVVIFDERSSLGLVRLRVKKVAESLDRIFLTINEKTAKGITGDLDSSPFAEITDEDIDSLFS